MQKNKNFSHSLQLILYSNGLDLKCMKWINPLNAELNPICHLLALLGGATILVVSRLRVKGLMGEKGMMEEDWNDRSNWRKKII